MTTPLIGPRAWSASAVSRYLSCPQAFKYQYVDKIPRDTEEMPLHVRAGTVGHAGLEAAFKHRKATRGHGPMDDDETWAAAKKGILASWIAEKMPDPPNDDGQLNRVVGAVGATLESLTVPHDHIVGVEQKIYLTGDGAAVIGFIDLLLRPEPGVVVIRDWKFRSRLPDPHFLAKDVQGALYAAMVRRKYPWARTVFFEHYLPPITDSVRVEITRAQSDEAWASLHVVKEVVQDETEWPTQKGSQCQTCAFRPICPAWESERTERPDADLIATAHAAD